MFLDIIISATQDCLAKMSLLKLILIIQGLSFVSWEKPYKSIEMYIADFAVCRSFYTSYKFSNYT